MRGSFYARVPVNRSAGCYRGIYRRVLGADRLCLLASTQRSELNSMEKCQPKVKPRGKVRVMWRGCLAVGLVCRIGSPWPHRWKIPIPGRKGHRGCTSTCMQSRHQFAWMGLSIHQKVVCRGYPAIYPCVWMYPGGGTPIVLLYIGIVKPKLFFS